MQRFRRGISNPYQLYWGFSPSLWTRLEQFRVDFEVSAPSRLKWSGKVNVKHRGLCVGPVGVGVRSTLRYSQTPFAPPPLSSVDRPYYESSLSHITWSGKAGLNISSIEDHYGDLTTLGDEALAAPGFYRLEFWGCSHSSAAPNADGLACINTNGDASDLSNPYSYLFVDVTDA